MGLIYGQTSGSGDLNVACRCRVRLSREKQSSADVSPERRQWAPKLLAEAVFFRSSSNTRSFICAVDGSVTEIAMSRQRYVCGYLVLSSFDDWANKHHGGTTHLPARAVFGGKKSIKISVTSLVKGVWLGKKFRIPNSDFATHYTRSPHSPCPTRPLDGAVPLTSFPNIISDNSSRPWPCSCICLPARIAADPNP